MLIVWGTRRVERDQGGVADFCPICRELRAFHLVSVHKVFHLYSVSIGAGELVGHLLRCGSCETTYSADPSRYPATGESVDGDLEALIRSTNPRLREERSDRLALEERIRRSPVGLPADQREALLAEPFELLNPRVEERARFWKRFDRRSDLGCLGTVVVFFLLLFLCTQLHEPASKIVAGLAFAAIPIGVTCTILLVVHAPRRFARKSIVPRLVRALAPLAPLPEEIAHCLERCRAREMKIGKAVEADRLWASLLRAGGDG
jgi:hypothetical protein